MKRITQILFTMLLINILTPFIIAENFKNQNIQKGFIHVIGDKLIDEQGHEIFLRGFAIDPFSYQKFKKASNPYSKEQIFQFNKDKFKYFISEDDIINIRKMGCNVIRKQIHFYDCEIAPYKYDDNILQVFDELIERSYKHGVYVIISLTQAAQNSKQQDNMLAYRGKPLLWTDIEFQKRVIAFMGYMASHFAKNPGVAGYDVVNEPEAPSTKALYSFYSNVINEIRKFDKKHIIILEKAHFNADKCKDNPFGGKYNDTNIMLSLHYYNDANERAKVNPKFVQYDNKEEIQRKMKILLSYPNVKCHPIFVGEFSALWDANDQNCLWSLLEHLFQCN